MPEQKLNVPHTKLCFCVHCGHEWLSRLERRPRVCPRCKNYKWDEPKTPSPEA